MGGMRTGHHLAETEVRPDQRGVGLDIGAHHQDVARLQGRIVGEQTQQHLPQHIDLTRRPVAAVHLNRPVVRLDRPTLRGNRIGGDIGLQPAEQSVRPGRTRQELVGGHRRRQAALEFTEVTPEAGQRRVAGQSVALVVPARDDPALAAQRRPQRSARMRQPQVQVVVDGQRLEQLDIGGGQPGVSEQRQPPRQLRTRLPQLGNRGGVPHVWRVDPQQVHQPAPQMWLPVQVRRRLPGVSGQPTRQQFRPLPGIGGEQAGEPPRYGVTAPPAQVLLRAVGEVPQMAGHDTAPRLVETGVDHFEQRPGDGLRRPRVILAGAADLPDQGGRGPERHTGAHSVGAVATAQHMG